jgi:hypothetical protein
MNFRFVFVCMNIGLLKVKLSSVIMSTGTRSCIDGSSAVVVSLNSELPRGMCFTQVLHMSSAQWRMVGSWAAGRV